MSPSIFNYVNLYFSFPAQNIGKKICEKFFDYPVVGHAANLTRMYVGSIKPKEF